MLQRTRRWVRSGWTEQVQKVPISPCTAVPPAATQTCLQIICRLLRLRQADLCAAPMFPQPNRMWSPQGSQKSAPPPSSLRRRGPGLLSKVSSAAVFKQADHSQTEGAIAPGHSLGSCLVKKAEVNTYSLAAFIYHCWARMRQDWWQKIYLSSLTRSLPVLW